MTSLRNEFKAGALVAVALALFVGSIFVMGRERALFMSQLTFYADFTDVKGLNPGAPVRLGGIGIGRVSEVSFTSDVNNPIVRVTLLVNEPFAPRIRRDATAVIETQGLLGDRFLNILGGSEVETLPEYSVMRSQGPTDLTAVTDEVRKVSEKATAALHSLTGVLDQLQSEGVLRDIAGASKGIRQMVEAINNGQGPLNALLYNEAISKNLTEASSHVSASLRAIREGKGALHQLLFDEQLGQAVTTSITGVANLSTTLTDFFNEIAKSKGFVHSLLAEKVDGDKNPGRDFASLIHDLAAAADALANGKGTLGALLMDASLYDNATEITDQAKRSFILRQALKSALSE